MVLLFFYVLYILFQQDRIVRENDETEVAIKINMNKRMIKQVNFYFYNNPNIQL